MTLHENVYECHEMRNRTSFFVFFFFCCDEEKHETHKDAVLPVEENVVVGIIESRTTTRSLSQRE